VALGSNPYPWPERAPSRSLRDRRGRGAQYEGNFLSGKPRPGGGELHFAYISRKFLFDPMLFAENEEISAPPPRGFLIGIYKFYENWSTELLKRKGRTFSDPASETQA